MRVASLISLTLWLGEPNFTVIQIGNLCSIWIEVLMSILRIESKHTLVEWCHYYIDNEVMPMLTLN